MAIMNQPALGRVFMGRLPKDGDLLQELTNVCASQGVTQGQVSAIGAVTRARVGYYNLGERKYEYLDKAEHLEILSLMGNVSILDGKAMVHAHVILGDRQGGTFGGHLAEGCPVFACEYILQEFTTSTPLVRGDDEPTGLKLWVEK
ncbi:MAG: DUF296 domain-containing protein [Deltaproteobacteria bacterium]|nr:DUF296 domain-containing protein [Deltaproteobacteria bacterium]MCB2186343.1 DUF296 domain-containing protein [Deltaproteobacteria bacterium]